MNKIEGALYELHRMDALSARDQWVNRIHPLVKLVLTLVYIALVVSFSKYDGIGLLGMGVYPLAVFQLAELSLRESLRRLKWVLPLVCMVGILNPLLEPGVVYIGGVGVRAGILSMITLLIKGVFCVFASYLLIATTSMEKLGYALRLLHVPRALLIPFMLMIRYISLLLEEAHRIQQAYALRAPRQKGVHFRVWGSLAGQLLLRSMERAAEVYESMTLRGYQGDYRYVGGFTRFRMQDGIYFLVWGLLLGLFRAFPVLLILGEAIGGTG